MDWGKIRIFMRVAQAGSFAAAAENMFVNQSSLSRTVSSIEKDLGVTLFERSVRGLKLTEQGCILFECALNMSELYEKTEGHLTDSLHEPVGSLIVVAPNGLGALWLAPRLVDFSSKYPLINIDLRLSDREYDLGVQHSEVAIRLREPNRAHLVRRKLFDIHFHVYGSKEYIEKHGSPKGLSDLKDHNILIYGSDAPSVLSDLNWLHKAGAEAVGFNLRPIISINSISGLRDAVGSGVGMALLPDYAVGDSENIQPILSIDRIPTMQSYIVFHERERTTLKVRLFVDFLLSKAKAWHF